MEFKKREVKKRAIPTEGTTRQFKKREVKPKNPHRTGGPDLSHMKFHIEDAFKQQNRVPQFGMTRPQEPADTTKELNVMFSCEMFELGEFNQIDMLCPYTSYDKKYEMETGSRSYVYPVDDDNPSESIQKTRSASKICSA